jgi:hypothetical protein
MWPWGLLEWHKAVMIFRALWGIWLPKTGGQGGCHHNWHPMEPLTITPVQDMMHWHHFSLVLPCWELFSPDSGIWSQLLAHFETRTFVSHWVLSWHWKPHSAPSFGSVSRTSPLREAGWWPLGVAWRVMSFLSKYFLRSEIKLPCLVESRSEINCHYVGTQYCFYSTGAIIRWVEIVVAHKNDTSQLTSEERGNIPFKKYSIKGF